jgi:hypothetical protein
MASSAQTISSDYATETISSSTTSAAPTESSAAPTASSAAPTTIQSSSSQPAETVESSEPPQLALAAGNVEGYSIADSDNDDASRSPTIEHVENSDDELFRSSSCRQKRRRLPSLATQLKHVFVFFRPA